MYTIYAITCLANSRVYIGCTKSYQSRIRCHLKALAKDTHTNKALQEDFRRHGGSRFRIEPLEHHAEMWAAFKREQEIIGELIYQIPIYNCYIRGWGIGEGNAVITFGPNAAYFKDMHLIRRTKGRDAWDKRQALKWRELPDMRNQSQLAMQNAI